MSKVVIYKKEYDLPETGKEFTNLQKQIEKSQKTIQEGKKKFAFIPWRNLSFEEKFQEMDFLIKNYEDLLALLTNYKNEYLNFFDELSLEIFEIVKTKTKAIEEVERERQTIEREAKNAGEAETLRIVETQKEELLSSTEQLAKATLLIIKKLELFKNALKNLTEDQDLQKQIFDQLVGKMNRQKGVYELQKKIRKVQRDVREFAQKAMRFEEDMRKSMGPFQSLFQEVFKVDNSLTEAVSEIKNIAETLMNETQITVSGEIDEKWLGYLVQGNLIKGQVEDLVSGRLLSDVKLNVTVNTEPSVDRSLENIKALTQAVIQPTLDKREAERKAREEVKRKAKEEMLRKVLTVAGQTYKIVKIGKQIWMAENLNIDVEGSCFYNNDPENGRKYGRLYTWEAAKAAADLVPGWHLPTDEELQELEMCLGMSASDAEDTGDRNSGSVGTKLKEGGSSGFDAPLAGFRHSAGDFDGLGSYGYFWSASPSGGSDAFFRCVYRSGAGVYRLSGGRTDRFSVRLVKD